MCAGFFSKSASQFEYMLLKCVMFQLMQLALHQPHRCTTLPLRRIYMQYQKNALEAGLLPVTLPPQGAISFPAMDAV